MTTSFQKQQIKQTWDVKKLQDCATKMVAEKIAGRLKCIEKHPGKEIEEMEKASAHLRSETMKKCGVKTPMDLVKHLAEFEVNMFGTQASIGGEEKNAVLYNEKPTVWLEAKKLIHLTKAQEETLQHHYCQWMEHLAQGFGFKADVEVANDGNSSQITFSSK